MTEACDGKSGGYNHGVLLERFWKVVTSMEHFIQNPPRSQDAVWVSFLKTMREVQVDPNARNLFEKRWSNKKVAFWISQTGVGLITVDGMTRSFVPMKLLTKAKYIPQLIRATDRGEIAKTGRVLLVDLQQHWKRYY